MIDSHLKWVGKGGTTSSRCSRFDSLLDKAFFRLFVRRILLLSAIAGLGSLHTEISHDSILD